MSNYLIVKCKKISVNNEQKIISIYKPLITYKALIVVTVPVKDTIRYKLLYCYGHGINHSQCGHQATCAVDVI